MEVNGEEDAPGGVNGDTHDLELTSVPVPSAIVEADGTVYNDRFQLGNAVTT